uniref:Integron gene cassette protein n=1 Tax=Mesocestoides corti TaxID=53468 RepID=A0A5K3FNL0_MESCO
NAERECLLGHIGRRRYFFAEDDAATEAAAHFPRCARVPPMSHGKAGDERLQREPRLPLSLHSPARHTHTTENSVKINTVETGFSLWFEIPTMPKTT